METKRYIHIEDNKYLKVQVYYDLGGMNYFTGKQESRGYYIMVKPIEKGEGWESFDCLLYTSPSPRDVEESRMPSSA